LRGYGDQYRTFSATATKLIGNLESIAARHFNIKKYDVRAELCCFAQRLRPILRKSNVIPFAPEQDA
jgi:hypothetical protein